MEPSNSSVSSSLIRHIHCVVDSDPPPPPPQYSGEPADQTLPLIPPNSYQSLQSKFEAIAARISSGSSSSSLFQPSNHSHSDHFNSQSSILWSQDPNHYKEVLPIFGSESASTDQSDRELAIRDQESYIEECLADSYTAAGEEAGSGGGGGGGQANQVISDAINAGGQQANHAIKAGGGSSTKASGKAGGSGGRLSMSSKWDEADRWIMKLPSPSPPPSWSSSSSAGAGASGAGRCTAHSPAQKLMGVVGSTTPTVPHNYAMSFPKGNDADVAVHAGTKLWLGADKEPLLNPSRRSPYPQPQRRSMKEVGTDTCGGGGGSGCAASAALFPPPSPPPPAPAEAAPSPPRHNTPTRRSRRSRSRRSVSGRSSTAEAEAEAEAIEEEEEEEEEEDKEDTAPPPPPLVELRECHLAKLKLSREQPLSCPIAMAAPPVEDPGSSRITITYDKWPVSSSFSAASSSSSCCSASSSSLAAMDSSSAHRPNPNRPTLITANHSLISPWPHGSGFFTGFSDASYLSHPYASDDHHYFCRHLPPPPPPPPPPSQFAYDYSGGAFDLVAARAAAWEDVERAKYTAKFKREEAKIEAWESLQRAEAEAELKKLEVKLEKLRFGSREKILGRLWAAEKRAEEMRAAAQGQKAQVLARVSARANQIRQNRQLPAFINVCFTKKPPN